MEKKPRSAPAPGGPPAPAGDDEEDVAALVARAPATRDALLGGAIAYAQPARGYRVGLEAPLLAAFALRPGRRAPRRVVDLGAGAGAVGLCLGRSLPGASLALVEREPFAARCARANVTTQGWRARARVVEADAAGVDAALGRGVADLVVSNPPWFWEGHGAPSADPARRAARQLAPPDLDALLRAARQLLGRGGRLCLTFAAPSLAALFAALGRQGLVAKRLKLLHPRPGEAADVAFVEALAAKPGGLEVEAPWFVRGEGEAYSNEVGAA